MKKLVKNKVEKVAKKTEPKKKEVKKSEPVAVVPPVIVKDQVITIKTPIKEVEPYVLTTPTVQIEETKEGPKKVKIVKTLYY